MEHREKNSNCEFEKALGRLEIVDFLSEKGEICLQGSTGAKMWITSLNPHFVHQEPQHKILRVRKSGAEAPQCSLALLRGLL